MSPNASAPIRLLGIDPGLNTTGYAVLDVSRGGNEATIVEAGVIQTDRKAPLAERLAKLYDDLAGLLAETRPAAAAVEKLYAHYKHPATAILMGHARGALLLACAAAGVPVHDFAATMVKRALTGNGHASKQQVQRAVTVVCGLREAPEPPDVADALAIALCAGKHLQSTDYTDCTD